MLFGEWVGAVVHAVAYSAKTIVWLIGDRCDQLCVGCFVAGGSTVAVFCIERDVKNRAELLLVRERLAHRLFEAGIVIANRY